MWDIVLMHPGGENMRGLQGPYFPIGWLGMVSLLKRHGWRALIVNAFLERLIAPSSTLADIIRQYPSEIYGIDLHWFVHCYEGIALAEQIKRVRPESTVVVGGLTASMFAEEILRHFPCVDAVIRGEGEIPLLAYVQERNQGARLLADVPNLSYRDKAGNTIHNPLSYVASQEDVDSLECVDFTSVVHHDRLFHLNNADYVIDAPCDDSPFRYLAGEGVPKNWVVYTGRGCCHDCSFCGGACSAFAHSHNRRTLVLRAPERVGDDILSLVNDMGVELLYFPHTPLTTPSEYHLRLLDYLQKRAGKIPCGFFFEDTAVNVDGDVLRQYSRVFDAERSVIRAYIADAAEDVRGRNSFAVRREAVKALHDLCLNLPVILQTAVLIGLPGQNRATVHETATWLGGLRDDLCYPLIYTAEMHPGSRLHRFPKEYGVRQQVASFRQFYRHLRSRRNKAMFLGYTTRTDCTAKQQRRILERALRIRTQVLTFSDQAPPAGRNRVPDAEMNRYVKMIVQAVALKAQRVVYAGGYPPSPQQLRELMKIAASLCLAITIRCPAEAIPRYLPATSILDDAHRPEWEIDAFGHGACPSGHNEPWMRILRNLGHTVRVLKRDMKPVSGAKQIRARDESGAPGRFCEAIA